MPVGSKYNVIIDECISEFLTPIRAFRVTPIVSIYAASKHALRGTPPALYQLFDDHHSN